MRVNMPDRGFLFVLMSLVFAGHAAYAHHRASTPTVAAAARPAPEAPATVR